VATQLLDLGLAVEREHGKAGVILLSHPLITDRLLQRLDALEAMTGLVQAGGEDGGVEQLDHSQLRLGQCRHGLALLG